MIKVLTDLVQFLLTCAPLLTSVAVFALFAILLAKPIKRHPGVWYTVFAIPFILVAVPTILRWCGIDPGFSFTRVPVLGQILRDYIHMGTFGHPLLIVIMYMGALDTRRPAVKKLMSIRKELSIISGFPVFTHSLIRVANNFPNSLKFFTDNAGYLENSRVTSTLGAGISSFSFVLGIIMLVLFIPLWVTSFDRIHRRMGNVRWKKLQRWSYVFYATLFIHAMGIQVGALMNHRGGDRQQAPTTVVQTSSAQESRQGRPNADGAGEIQEGERTRSEGSQNDAGTPGGHRGPDTGGHQSGESAGHEQESRKGAAVSEREGRGDNRVSESASARPASGERTPATEAQQPARRVMPKGFSDIKLGATTRGYIQIASLLLIYGSYLYLRIRKARRSARRRSEAARA